MKRKRLLSDPSLWMLLAINGYSIWYYYLHPESFTTLVWVYWTQSVTLGLFNFVDILTVRKVYKNPDEDGQPGSSLFTRRIPSAIFFIVHYGFFHLVYSIFVYSMKRSGPFDSDLFRNLFFAFLMGQVITFIQHKIQQRKQETNIGTMFFTPYLRVVPMHLTILLPEFLHISSMGVFLVFKSAADAIMYIVTKPSYTSRETDTALLATQQGTTL